MDYYVYKNGATENVAEIVADTVAKANLVPTDFAVGSRILILETGEVKVLGTDKVWHTI